MIKKIFSIFLIFNLTFATSAQAAATYTGVPYDLFEAQDDDYRGLAFNNDGTKVYHVGARGDDINEYILSTPFDLSTAVFRDYNGDGTGFSIAAQETIAEDLVFNNDGTKMFMVGAATSTVAEYNLSTAFDTSTAAFVTTFDLSNQTNVVESLVFNNDGTKLFIPDSGPEEINEYNLSTPFDVSTAVFRDFNGDGTGYDISGIDIAARNMRFNNDGTKVFLLGAANDAVFELTMTTAYELSTATLVDSFSIADQGDIPEGLVFNNDGTKMFVTDLRNGQVDEYTLSCAFAVTAKSTCEVPSKIKDIRGIVDAQISTAKNFAKDSSRSILKRLAILSTSAALINTNENAQNIELNFQNETLKKISNSVLSSAPAKLNPLQQILPDNWSSWSDGSISFAEIDNNPLSSAQDITSLGISVGADKKTDNDKVLGVALRIGKTDVDVGTYGSAVNTDALSLSVYGSNSFDDSKFLEHVIGVSYLDSDIRRKDEGDINTQTGDREGRQVFGSLNLAREYENGDVTVTPKGRIDGSYTELDDYTENGNEALKFNKQDIKSLMASVGVLIGRNVNLSNSIVKSRIDFEYGKDFASNSNVVTRYISDNVATSYQADNKDRDIFTAGVGFDFKHDQGLTISTDYQRQQISGSGLMNTFSLSASFLSRNETEFALGLDEDMTSNFKISKALGVFDLGFGLENDFSSQENRNANLSLSSKF